MGLRLLRFETFWCVRENARGIAQEMNLKTNNWITYLLCILVLVVVVIAVCEFAYCCMQIRVLMIANTRFDDCKFEN